MDPFSILAGTAGLADVAFRILKYLTDIKAASGKIQDEIIILRQEIKSLVAVVESVEDFPTPDWSSSGATNDIDSRAHKVWEELGLLLQQCKVTIEQLEELLSEVVGKKGSYVAGKIDGIRKTIRRKGRDGEYMQIRQRLANCQNGIQMLLAAINLYHTLKSQKTNDLTLDRLSEILQRQNNKLIHKMHKLRQDLKGSADSQDLHSSLVSADAVASLIRFNKYFHMPQNVSSYYTGRHKQLQELASILNITESRQPQTHQKRFVISGLGGSGKTQFCCKFAQDNREHFWGVFWIDGSSYENAQHSYAEIAKIGGVEPNANAAKNWLSSLEHPWLLLIDNADDPEIDMMRYFPKGESGVILITTRNPSNKRHGTEGCLFFHFDKLETDEASDLLLAAAVFPRPWGELARKQAANIAQVLGYLPLALIHAGKAILDKLCSLSDYTEYYERTWSRIRRSRSRSASRGMEAEHVSSMSVYSSYEMIYLGLESKRDQRSMDALELLRMFSFFYRENIAFDLLKTAALNPRREREDAQAKEEQDAKKKKKKKHMIRRQARTWKTVFRDWGVTIAGQLTRSSTILPEVLRDADDTPFEEDRLRSALSLLVRLGMITSQDENNSYWMHPLVHTWVRERPGTSTAEQAIWCQAAATVLVQSIFFQAPHAYEARNETLKRQIHPHVEHVLRLQEAIDKRLEENQKALYRPWPLTWLIPQPGFRSFQAAEYAKFSLVYMHCGYYAKAEVLQLQVKDYIFANLGPESTYGIKIALLLSFTYALQAHSNEARILQYQVLEAAKKYYGPNDPMTLQIMDSLGATCVLCSRLEEANRLHTEVIEKLSGLEDFGPEHENTWTAMDNLSKVKLKLFDIEEGFRLQSQAYEGLQKILGPTHPKTLEAKDNLAGICGFIGEEHLPRAHQMSEEVVQIRVKELGREHPLTLKSKLTLAKIKTAMNQFEEAEEIFLEGLPAAERNLGEYHLGTLTGRTWLGHLYWRQGRYSEAATVWEDVIEKRNYELSKRADGEHADRLQAMWFLAHCYEDQGRIDDALKICEQLTELLRTFGGETTKKPHKLWQYVAEKKEELLGLKEQNEKYTVTGDERNVSPIGSLPQIPPKKVVKDLTF
ncbi:hypothetical protein FQN57_007256 [Myotisia sp. PD_48]|nr:hypothetical protein FQN57_007256 [Myotisia sp. PD_48]